LDLPCLRRNNERISEFNGNTSGNIYPFAKSCVSCNFHWCALGYDGFLGAHIQGKNEMVALVRSCRWRRRSCAAIDIKNYKKQERRWGYD
jgi:hypothetical protein